VSDAKSRVLEVFNLSVHRFTPVGRASTSVAVPAIVRAPIQVERVMMAAPMLTPHHNDRVVASIVRPSVDVHDAMVAPVPIISISTRFYRRHQDGAYHCQ